jgi:hypothetical protein
MKRSTPYEPEVRRARQILVDLIELSGMSLREVASRLLDEDVATDVSRLLVGKLDLKLRHILAITRVIGLDPAIFFILLLPEPEASPLLDKIRPVLNAEKRRLRRAAARLTPGDPTEDLEPVRRVAKDLIEQLLEFIAETSGSDAPSGGAQTKTEKAHRRPTQVLGVPPARGPGRDREVAGGPRRTRLALPANWTSSSVTRSPRPPSQRCRNHP